MAKYTSQLKQRIARHREFYARREPRDLLVHIKRLAFDPTNKWMRFARDVNCALWNYWEEDFCVLPYLHRSPLDAANGLRGTELFVDIRKHEHKR